MLDDIRIEKIILAPIWACYALIWATNPFLEISALLDVKTLSQAAILCNIKENKWCKLECQKPWFRAPFWPQMFFQEFSLY